ncbi:hypothetical protein [Streptococcus suis]|uniref:hypothetical protein n=1 Tax=Streptococcus suis TaxID=1307 RepID=UPI000CF37A13|nr:hypothetical protein [Streptococcus suis]
MPYRATLILNGHQPVNIGYFDTKESAAEAIINHAKNNSAEKRLRFIATKKIRSQTIRIDYGAVDCYYLITISNRKGERTK